MSGSNRLPYEQAAISVAVVRRRHRFRPFAGVRNSAEGPPASNNDARPQLRQAGESGVSGCPVWTAATSAGRNSRDSSGCARRRGDLLRHRPAGAGRLRSRPGHPLGRRGESLVPSGAQRLRHARGAAARSRCSFQRHLPKPLRWTALSRSWRRCRVLLRAAMGRSRDRQPSHDRRPSCGRGTRPLCRSMRAISSEVRASTRPCPKTAPTRLERWPVVLAYPLHRLLNLMQIADTGPPRSWTRSPKVANHRCDCGIGQRA